MKTVHYRYNSLEDFLISSELTVDGQLNDGWGAFFPVKGREIEATVLFADISGFSSRTLELSATETLIYVNNFFSWITAQALRSRNGIIDKYIGDEVMIVYSREFGSTDPFVDAVQAARNMSDHDVHSFRPHIGISSGRVTVGYVGTPLKYNCSVFGSAVALAARCAAVKPELSDTYSSYMVFPSSEWNGRDFDAVFPPNKDQMPDGTIEEEPHAWEMLPSRAVEMKNVGTQEVLIVGNAAFHFPTQSPEERARESLAVLKQQGRFNG